MNLFRLKNGNSTNHKFNGHALLLIPLVLGCFTLLPNARAVKPPPDGGYVGNNTAEGDAALQVLTTGTNNTALGFHALNSNGTGSNNTATGYLSLHISTRAGNNTADGSQALSSNTTGSENTAVGMLALGSNQDGRLNTANGFEALRTNQHGSENTATGDTALFANTADGNTADGSGALHDNTTGNGNTATGDTALFFNTTGSNNTADGFQALVNNRTITGREGAIGHDNTANGYQALATNTIGVFNTATGSQALFSNSTGSENTALGFGALFFNNGGDNTAVGDHSMTQNTSGVANTAVGQAALNGNMSGNGNIALGGGAGGNLTTGDNNIDIYDPGVAGEANTIRIGTQGTQTATFVAGISGVTLANGVGVVIDTTTGQLGVGAAVSSARFKADIKPMDKASEAILALKPVTFHYSKEIDLKSTAQFGLVAEEVEKVNPALVTRDRDGKPYTVRYEAVNAMLLNEFLKEHRAFLKEQLKVEEQQATITQLKNDLESKTAEQRKQIEALTAGLQKVSAEVEMSRPAPRMADNNQ